MKRLILAFIILCSLATIFALTWGGCEPIPMTTIDVTAAPYYADNTGVNDATAAIQAAIDAAGDGDTVSIPTGTYRVIAPVVDQYTTTQALYINGAADSNITLAMAVDAELKIDTSNDVYFSVIQLSEATNVTISGGIITGDYDAHGVTEHAFGIRTWNCNNVTFDGVHCRKNQGDGFTVDGNSAANSHDNTLQDCIGNYNRRGGYSLQCGAALHVIRGEYAYNTGASPKFGVDCEPYTAGQSVYDVDVSGANMHDNVGGGFVAGGNAGANSCYDITLTGNILDANDLHAIWTVNVQNLTLSGNTISGNGGSPGVIDITGTDSTGWVISGNTWTGNTGTQFNIESDDAMPLINDTIAGFVPPTGKVHANSTVIDGIYTWRVDGTGLIWTKSLTPVTGEFKGKFGICQSHINLMSDIDIEATMAHAEEIGATWIRTVFAWTELETAVEGVWDFTQHDKVVAAAVAHNLDILGITITCRAWGNPPSGGWLDPPNEAGMAKWALYHTTIADRYPEVKAWEIGNELGWSYADYVAALHAAYDVIKAVDPDLVVSFEGVAGINADYIHGCLALGADDYCDVFAFHPYPNTYNDGFANFPNEEHLRYWLGSILRPLMAPHTDKPLWATEFGWNNPTEWGYFPTTSALAAAYQFRTMVIDADDIGTDYDIQRFFLYDVQDYLNVDNYGIVDLDWDHKPSFGYYKTFQSTLGLCEDILDPATVGTFVADSMPTFLETHCFSKTDGTMYVALWNRQDDPEGGVENEDTVDITITDTGFISVDSVALSDGSLTPVEFTQGEGEIGIAALPIGWDAVLLQFAKEGATFSAVYSAQTRRALDDTCSYSAQTRRSVATVSYSAQTRRSITPPAGPPVIISIDPDHGPAGTQVTLTGTGFGETQSSSKVLFGTLEANIISWNDTEIVCTSPEEVV